MLNEKFLIKNEELKFELLSPKYANECLKLQDSLSDTDKKSIVLRELNEYEKFSSGNNYLLGIRNSQDEIIAISAGVEIEYEIILSENSSFYEFTRNKKINFMELSVSIVDFRYRGNGLQAKMYQKLMDIIKTSKKEIMFNSACIIGNLGSCKNIMDLGFEICGIFEHDINGKMCNIITFIKHPKLSSIKSKIELSNGEEILLKKELLKEILNSGNSILSQGNGKSRKYYIVER